MPLKPTAKKSGGMPKWKPSSLKLIQIFEKASQAMEGAEARKVFGYPAAFINGTMFAGLHQEHLVLRLSEKDRVEFLGQKGAVIFEPMPGRPMKEYVVVPEEVLQTAAPLQAWLKRAQTYTQSLPPKKKLGARKKRPG